MKLNSTLLNGRRVLGWIGGAVALALVVAWLAGAFGVKTGPGDAVATRPEAPPAFREVVAVRAEEAPRVERAAGTISARREVMVSARIMAAIGDIAVRAGDRVERGQTLVELDSRDLRAREQQAAETVRAAEARLKEAAKEYRRLKQLLADGVIARSQFDTAEAAHTTAQAALARARQGAEEARTGRSWATIAAPIGGRVVDRYAEPGDTAMPGQPLVKLYDPRHMRAEAYVRESLVGALRPGEPIAVWIDALDTRVEGRIEEIVPQAEPGSRTALCKVALPSHEDIYPGMFARVLIPAGTTRRLTIPAEAVTRVGQLTYVWVVTDDDRARRQFVQPGRRDAQNRVEILSGLDDTDSVGVVGH